MEQITTPQGFVNWFLAGGVGLAAALLVLIARYVWGMWQEQKASNASNSLILKRQMIMAEKMNARIEVLEEVCLAPRMKDDGEKIGNLLLIKLKALQGE